MRDKLINLIRSVPIADKTYPEYVEALADKIADEMALVRQDTLWEAYDHLLKLMPVTSERRASREQRKAD